MIDKRVYELDYIRGLQQKYASDPGLIERALYAFGLLEAIKSFLNKKEDIRKGKNGIVKRHFRFTYFSPLRNTEFYIMLDVVFAHLPYAKTIQKEIRNDLLLIGLIHPLRNLLSLLLFKLAEAFIHLKQTSVHHLMLTHNVIISSGLPLPGNLCPNKDIFSIR